ncbi:MAG: hypothetical protein MUF53_02775 [Gemmatimonadaceae bacterium]|jgi:hypothetical protein|nr:hypothetical protein [Gemmatimonadaceae bacterium]
MTTELEPPREPDPYPPMTTRDKLVLVGAFAVALLALFGIVATWDTLPFIRRPAP